MSRTAERLLVVLILALTASAGGTSTRAADMPKLVVVISIDQLPFRYLEQMRAGFAKDGFFLKMLDDGAVFEHCYHGHSTTKTGPGHSVLLTGTFPGTTGIVQNNWYDRERRRLVYCVEDRDSPLVGPLDDSHERGASPRNLLVDTLGDVLKLAYPTAKVVGVAMKDRAAVLMTGHAADAVYWFDDDSGLMVTSTYYTDKLPDYMRAFNSGGTATSYAGEHWKPLFEPNRYQIYPGQPEKGTFDHLLSSKVGAQYYSSLARSPYGNDLTLALARLVVSEEELGKDETPDLLAINLSSNDYVGHAYGPHSLEVQDMTFRTDRQLGEFMTFLEEHMKGQPWLVVLSSDHGVAPIPEHAKNLKIPAGRETTSSIKALRDRIEAALRQQFGDPEQDDDRYVEYVGDGDVYLDATQPELAGDRRLTAQRIVRDVLLEDSMVAAAYTREDLLQPGATGLGERFQRSFSPKRSGDVMYALRPYFIHGRSSASHGTPWTYDSHVPLLMRGAGVRAGRYFQRVTPAHIAPTLAELLNIDPPSAASVEAIEEVLDR